MFLPSLSCKLFKTNIEFDNVYTYVHLFRYQLIDVNFILLFLVVDWLQLNSVKSLKELPKFFKLSLSNLGLDNF